VRSLPPLLAAVDLGNSAAKAAIAAPDEGPSGWRWTGEVQRLGNDRPWQELSLPEQPIVWAISSVHGPRLANFRDWLAVRRPQDARLELTWKDVPLAHDVRSPERVGMDRWMGVVAAAKRWESRANGLVVLAGTAITVNLLREGAFAGGAILPGFDMALGSLHHGTDRLPDLAGRLQRLEPLPGRDTESAIYAGVGWGTVGAVREIGRRLAEGLPEPRWIISGGNAEMLAEGLQIDAEVVQTLTLEGVVETFLASDREPVSATTVEQDDDR
jgi:type III pantothenate kinase